MNTTDTNLAAKAEKVRPSHQGHRQRLKERWLSSGASAFNERDKLELLLSFALPRKDTKPIAMELLNQFGSLSATLKQPVERLCLIDGLGSHAAILLNLTSLLSSQNPNTALKGTIVKSPHDVEDYLLREYGLCPEEKVILLILNQANRIIDAPILEDGIENRANIYLKKAVRMVFDRNGTGVILVHNHPSGQAEFSPQDVELTSKLDHALRPLEIRLLDHFLITNDQLISMKSEGIAF